MKLQEGRQYIRRDGEVTVPLKSNVCPLFCFKTNILEYTVDGVCRQDDRQLDIVAEYVKGKANPDASSVNANVQLSYGGKEMLTFWEAREAALIGKKVQRDSGVAGIRVMTADNIHDTIWNEHDFAAEWEIVVEPPKHNSHVVVVYNNYLSDPKDICIDSRKYGSPLNYIEITVDANGKLISARNV
jgi:hypothetical protein